MSSTAWHPTVTSIFLSSLFCIQPTGTQCRVRPGIQQKHPSFYHHCSVYSPLGHSVEYGLASNSDIHPSIIIVLFTAHWDTVSSTAWHPTETSIFLSSLFCLQPTGTQYRVRPGIQQKHPSFYHHCSVYSPLGHSVEYGLASNRDIHLSIIIVLFTAHWDTVSVRPGIQQRHPSFYHNCSVYSPLGHSIEYGLASNRNIHLSIIIVLFTAHWDTVSSTAWHPTVTSIFLSSLFCLQPTGTQYRVRPGIQQKHPSFYHHCSVYSPLGHSIEYGLASNRNIHLSIIIVLFTAHWDTVSSTAWHPTETSNFLSSLFCLQPTGTQCRVRPGIQQRHPSFYHHCPVYNPLGHSVSTAWHPTETSIFLSSLFCLQPTGTQNRVRPGIQQKHPSFYHHCSVYSPLGHSVEYGLASNRNIHLSIIIVLFTTHWDTVSSTAWHPTETSIFLSSLFCLQPTGTLSSTAWHPTETSIFLSSLFCLQPTGTQC